MKLTTEELRKAPHRSWRRRFSRRYSFGIPLIWLLPFIPLGLIPVLVLGLWPIRGEWPTLFSIFRWLWFGEVFLFCLSSLPAALSYRTLYLSVNPWKPVPCPPCVWFWSYGLTAIFIATGNIPLAVATANGTIIFSPFLPAFRKPGLHTACRACLAAIVLLIFFKGTPAQLWAILAIEYLYGWVAYFVPRSIREDLDNRPSPEGHLQEAREKYDRASNAITGFRQTKRSVAYISFFDALMAVGKYQKAADFVDAHPQPTGISRNFKKRAKAYLFFEEGRYEKVVDLISEEDIAKDYQLGLRASCALVMLGREAEAARWLGERKGILDWQEAIIRSLVLRKKDDLDGALKITEGIFRGAQVFREQAILLMEMGDDGEAAPMWERAFRMEKFIRLDDLRQAAKNWRSAGNVKRAEYLEREIQRWLKRHPTTELAAAA